MLLGRVKYNLHKLCLQAAKLRVNQLQSQQRMDLDSILSMNLPLQAHKKMSTKKTFEKLESYLPQRESIKKTDRTENMPKQIPSNPFHPISKKVENRPFANFVYEKQYQSVNKCLVTEISLTDEPEESEPICKKLFEKNHIVYHGNVNDISEATFKPNELKRCLSLGIYSEALKKQNQKNQVREKSSRKVTTSQIFRVVAKPKTKYEKILEEYFKSGEKTVKPVANLMKVPNYRLKYTEQDQIVEQIGQNAKKSTERRQSTQMKLKQNLISNINLSNLIKIQDNTSSITSKNANRSAQLKKTFSQKKIKTQGNQTTSRDRETTRLTGRWMSMTFSQRQQKTINNRKIKEEMGKLIEKEKQVKGCTFRPELTQFKPKTKEKSHISYAAMYLQKIKKRL